MPKNPRFHRFFGRCLSQDIFRSQFLPYSEKILKKILKIAVLAFKLGQSGVKWSALELEEVKFVFLGTYQPKMDDKGRLQLPAKYREQLANGLVITRGQERCLYIFPVAEFEYMYQELRKAPLASKQARDYVRVMLSGASDETPDKQGRFVIPQMLRKYANLDKELVVIGSGARVEVWNAENWENYLAVQEENFSETAEEIIPGMF